MEGTTVTYVRLRRMEGKTVGRIEGRTVERMEGYDYLNYSSNAEPHPPINFIHPVMSV